jgi:DNA-binding CsgD family transcriptional regulator
MYGESAAVYRASGDPWSSTNSLAFLAHARWFQGNYPAARPLFEEALSRFRELENKWGIAFVLYGMGCLALSQQDDATAAACFDEALPILREVGDRRGLIRPLYGLGRLALHQGDYATARTYLTEALTLARDIGDKWSVSICLSALAGVMAGQGQAELAARLFGGAESQREAIGVPIPPPFRVWYERDLAAARDRLVQASFAAAWAEGRNMTANQAVALLANPAAPSGAEEQASSPAAEAAAPPILPAGLTAREIEVLRLVATGLTDAQVAEKLVISVRTVNAHLSSIYSKLGVNSRTAAVRFATDHDLV